MTEQNKTTTIPLPVQGKDMDSIMQSLESGVEELFTSNRYQEFLRTMAKFHNYSFNNTMLIAMQRPDATLVTSYKNWQSMGRQVMKGEKGITIIAPAPYKKMKEKEVLDENQRPVMGTDGKPKTEQVEVTVPHFKAVTVFDIAQTSGEPIQTLAPELLTAAVQDFDSFMQAIQKISPVPIRFDEIDGNANGYYHNADKEIVIKKGLSESQTLKTAIHETAHSMGVAPIIGFNYGAENKSELQNIFRKSVTILGITNITMFVMAEVLTVPMAKIFVGYNQTLNELTIRGMRIYSVAFLVMGFNVFASAFFTALSNGKISAIISVTRTLILQLIMIYVMPMILGVDGLWAVVIAVEGISLIVTVYYILKNRKNYGYMK